MRTRASVQWSPTLLGVLMLSVIGAALFALGGPATAAHSSGTQKLTLYSVAEQEQYIDNADDEARGWEQNPFGLRDKKVQAVESQDRGGPYPGDETIFVF